MNVSPDLRLGDVAGLAPLALLRVEDLWLVHAMQQAEYCLSGMLESFMFMLLPVL